MKHLKLVVKIGGSVLGSPPDPFVVNSYLDVVSKAVSQGNEVALIVGGGRLAREFIKVAKELGLGHKEQDKIAIEVSRVNAKIFCMKLGQNTVPHTIKAMISRLGKYHVSAMGGLRPGITTDSVAAILAARWNADVMIKCSDQPGIFSSDPRKDANAIKLDEISYKRLFEIVGQKHMPGMHSIIDPFAVKKLAKLGIKLVVVDGRKPDNILGTIEGKKIGTVVT